MHLRLFAAILATTLIPTAHAFDLHLANRDSAGLIAAIERANRTPGPHTIRLSPGGLYTLSHALPGRLGLPAIHGRLTIVGNGAEIRRYTADPMTLIEIADDGRVELHRLTLAEGSRGAIRNRGRLVLDRVAVVDSAGDGARGIVMNYGELEARDSTFSYNQLHGTRRDAGTVINLGRMTLHAQRFVGNTLRRASADAAAAAAVLNAGYLEVHGMELADNEIDDYGGLASAVVNLDSGRVAGVDAGLTIDE